MTWCSKLPGNRPWLSGCPLFRSSSGLVGSSNGHLQSGPTGFPPTLWLLWHKGLEGDPEGRNPGASQSFAVQCREVGSTSQGAMQHSKGPPDVFGTPMCLKGDDILEASHCRQQARSVPNPGRRGCTLGQGSCPQEAQETNTCPPNCPEETPKPEVTAGVVGPLDIQWQLPSLPLGFGPPAMASCPPPLKDVEPLVHSPQRSPVGYNLPGLHGDGHSQECPNGKIKVLLQDASHLNNVPVAESIWGQGPGWCWPGTNGLVDWVSTHSKNPLQSCQ